MLNFRAATNAYDTNSLSNRMRNRRIRLFEKLTETLPKPLNLIDIGGTEEFWQQRGWIGREDVNITAVNLLGTGTKNQNVNVEWGDATNLANYADSEFDVAFSNSVIEHLYNYKNQCKMAAEVQRVATAYWVQTPNFWFPFEPHFHILGWQWMPRAVRVGVIRRRQCGWRGPCSNVEDARAAVDEVRLMTKAELRRAFLGAEIWNERMFGMVKSMVAYGGFGTTVENAEKALRTV